MSARYEAGVATMVRMGGVAPMGTVAALSGTGGVARRRRWPLSHGPLKGIALIFQHLITSAVSCTQGLACS